jgi:hypothetical protein
LLKSLHIRRFIKILFAALVAAHREVAVEGGQWHHGVCLGKRNAMVKKLIPPKMIPMVFAEHYPTIIGVFPHRSTRPGSATIGPRLSIAR